MVDHYYHRGDIRLCRRVVIRHPQGRSVGTELPVSVGHLYTAGVHAKGYVVVIEVPLVLHDVAIRATVSRAAPVKGHLLIGCRRVGTGRYHRHRLVVVNRQGRAARIGRPEAVGHPQADGVGNAQGEAGQISPRHCRHHAHGVVKLAVVIQIPFVGNNAITGTGVGII